MKLKKDALLPQAKPSQAKPSQAKLIMLANVCRCQAVLTTWIHSCVLSFLSVDMYRVCHIHLCKIYHTGMNYQTLFYHWQVCSTTLTFCLRRLTCETFKISLVSASAKAYPSASRASACSPGSTMIPRRNVPPLSWVFPENDTCFSNTQPPFGVYV